MRTKRGFLIPRVSLAMVVPSPGLVGCRSWRPSPVSAVLPSGATCRRRSIPLDAYRRRRLGGRRHLHRDLTDGTTINAGPALPADTLAPR